MGAPVMNSARIAGVPWRLIALAVGAVVGVLVGLGNIGLSLDRALRSVAWELRSQPASGVVHVVEVDAHSIAAIPQWPWPRSNYVKVLEQLRRAGAATIAFDIDFSSPSTAAEDAAFAEALKRSEGKVVLPTFGQTASGASDGWRDAVPIPALRAHSALAAVSILPDPDGYVRHAPMGTITRGVARPSFSAMLSGRSGSAGQHFPIDFSIDPATVPRHSFIDIRDGRFAPGSLTGKTIVIGATAVELGDRYAVPNHGVIAGVVIQALGVETLIRGVPQEGGWFLPLLLALVLAVPILLLRSRRALLAAIIAMPIILFGAAVLIDDAAGWLFPLAPAWAALGTISGAALAVRWLNAAHRRRGIDRESGLPNRTALREDMRERQTTGIAAARIADFEKLAAGLNDQAMVDLIHRVRDRIATTMGNERIFRIEDRVLAWRVADEEALEPALLRLRSLMLTPVEVAGRRVDVTLALGFVRIADSRGTERAIAQAVLAADRAQNEGVDWYAHQQDDHEVVERELSLLGELDEAIGGGEIDVHYQPKLDLKRGVVTSVEALVRWHHPKRGFLRPDLFIPLAERNNRIAALTLYVVERMIMDLRAWEAAGHRISGAANISAKLLSSGEFPGQLRALIQESGFAPERLIFEVTETAAVSDPVQAAGALQSFRELGVAISMDDYGTGQSTLSYLKELPLSELKIDRSFVQSAHEDRGDAALVRSTVHLAHELGLRVVAEGVEDAACLAFLRSVGCDFAQGYHIGKPMPAAALAEFLDDHVASRMETRELSASG